MENDNKFIVEQVWINYELMEKRRRNSFYYLFTTIAIYTFILTNPEKGFEIPLFNVEVDLFIAMVISPAIFAVVTSSYLFLSTHALVSFVDFLNLFYDFSVKNRKGFISEYRALLLIKRRDLTQFFNPYLFPIKTTVHWKKRYPRFLLLFVPLVMNSLTLAIVILPYFAYFFVLWWLIKNYSEYTSIGLMVWVFIFYFFATIGFIAAPIIFFFRVRKTRETLRIWKEEYLLSL